MGVGPAVAIPAAVEAAGLQVQDIDLFELNEVSPSIDSCLLGGLCLLVCAFALPFCLSYFSRFCFCRNRGEVSSPRASYQCRSFLM